MEVLHVAGSSREGGLAVVTKPGDNIDSRPLLSLLTYDHSIYANAAATNELSAGPACWHIDSGRRSITGYSRSGSPVSEVWWSGSSWSARRLE
jgi:hypothetical protein